VYSKVAAVEQTCKHEPREMWCVGGVQLLPVVSCTGKRQFVAPLELPGQHCSASSCSQLSDAETLLSKSRCCSAAVQT